MRSFWWPASHVHFMLLLIYFCFTILLLVLKLHVFILKKILIYTKQLYPMLLFGHNYFLVNVLHVVIDIFCEQYNLFFKDYGNKLNRNLWQYKVYCILYDTMPMLILFTMNVSLTILISYIYVKFFFTIKQNMKYPK